MFEENRKDWIYGLLVALIAFVVYANSLGNDFVWDDNDIIVNNLSLRGSALALFQGIDASRDMELTPYYRPLTLLTFLIEERLHGLSPFLMHLVNVLLHAVNAFLVYRLAKGLINDSLAALIAGLFFAVHPIQTEGVNFLSGGRNTLLACFFVLAAYLLHLRSVLQDRIVFATTGALVFLAALFSKEIALAVLPFIAAAEIASLKKSAIGSRHGTFGRLAPYAACTIIYGVMRSTAISNAGARFMRGFALSEEFVRTDIIKGLGMRLLDNLYIIPRYFLTVIWPPSLSIRYDVPDNLHFLALPLVAAWLCIACIVGWLITRGRSRATIFGLCWLAAFWVPVSGIIPFPSAPLADRYLYIPAIGLWIIVADQFVRLLPSGATVRRRGVVAAALVLFVLAAVTVTRNLDWRNDVTLYSSYTEQYPERAFGHYNLGGVYLYKVRDLDAAEREFEKTLVLDPYFPRLRRQMGYIRLLRGDNEGAVNHYDEALKLDPFDAEALLKRGTALDRLGMYEDALVDYKRFLLVPGNELPGMRQQTEARARELERLLDAGK